MQVYMFSKVCKININDYVVLSRIVDKKSNNKSHSMTDTPDKRGLMRRKISAGLYIKKDVSV